MALNFLTPNPDFVQKTAESRKITKTLVGEFTLDLVVARNRHKSFLGRNMIKVLAFHDRNRALGLQSGRPSRQIRGPFLGLTTAKQKPTEEGNSASLGSEDDDPKLNGDSKLNHHGLVESQADVESMSQDCLRVKVQNGSMAENTPDKRRSIRHQLARQHEDKNARLYMDLVSMRKKLNFKEQRHETDVRPRKRVRRESIVCHCHITIWDNREGIDQREPIVRKSELCEVLTSDSGPGGYVADIKLQNPFIFKSGELKVPIKSAAGTTLGTGDKYFLEIKIIPTRTDVSWPPIPILGRSEGDQSTGLGRMAAEKLQGALVARYLHLPTAPALDVPLSVFFLHEGRTYRSKYGLEVQSMWTRDDTVEHKFKSEDDPAKMDLWAVDEEGRTFGRRDSPKTKGSRSSVGKSHGQEKLNSSSPIKVTFNIDAASAKGTKDFRKCTVMGLKCPTCLLPTFELLEDLQFHFMTFHAGYKFVVEKQDFNAAGTDLIAITFKIVAITTTKPRNQDKDLRDTQTELKWQAPAEPLDVPAYVTGDQHWVEQNWVEGQPKKLETHAAVKTLATDLRSNIRQQSHAGFLPAQKGGFLPAGHVPDFRKADRKKHPPIKLKTMTSDREMMYTSVSHRRVQSDEDARSESDDEIDDSWFVHKSLEALDVAAEKQGWGEEQRLMRRKWNQMRLSEKLSHPRYLSDCLVRFIRAERSWLRGGGNSRRSAFGELLDELLQRRVINQDVIRDLWSILHNEEQTTPTDGKIDEHVESSTKKSNPRLGQSTVMYDLHSTEPSAIRQHQAEIWLQLPPYTCPICAAPVEELGRRDVRCSEHDCEAPGVWYHSSCVKCKRRDRLNWKCKLCIDRLEQISKRKGKEVALD